MTGEADHLTEVSRQQFALSMPMPLLHRAVLKMPPVAPQPTPEDAIVNLNFIAIVNEFDFPALAGNIDVDGHSIIAGVAKPIGDFGFVESSHD